MTNKKTPSPAADQKSNVDKPHPQSDPPDTARDFDDPVNEASDESFPASDPPSWTDTAASKDGD